MKSEPPTIDVMSEETSKINREALHEIDRLRDGLDLAKTWLKAHDAWIASASSTNGVIDSKIWLGARFDFLEWLEKNNDK